MLDTLKLILALIGAEKVWDDTQVKESCARILKEFDRKGRLSREMQSEAERILVVTDAFYEGKYLRLSLEDVFHSHLIPKYDETINLTGDLPSKAKKTSSQFVRPNITKNGVNYHDRSSYLGSPSNMDIVSSLYKLGELKSIPNRKRSRTYIIMWYILTVIMEREVEESNNKRNTERL